MLQYDSKEMISMIIPWQGATLTPTQSIEGWMADLSRDRPGDDNDKVNALVQATLAVTSNTADTSLTKGILSDLVHHCAEQLERRDVGDSNYRLLLGIHCALADQSYRWTQSPADLDRLISGWKELCRENYSPDALIYHCAAFAYLERYTTAYNADDLDNTIQYLIAEIDCRNHPCSPIQHVSALISLGQALMGRFSRMGRRDDLDGAISRFEQALDEVEMEHLMDDRHLHGGLLQELGISSMTRFEECGETTDIMAAVHYFVEADRQLPETYDRCLLLSSIGHAQSLQVDRGVVDNGMHVQLLQSAVEKHKDALGHHDDDIGQIKCFADYSFTIRVVIESGHSELLDDLPSLVKRIESAADKASTATHPSEVQIRRNLAAICLGSAGSDDAMTRKAFDNFKLAAKSVGSMRDLLSAALDWATAARRKGDPSTKDAYEAAMEHFDRCQMTYLTIDSKHEFLTRHLTIREATNLASDAASFAMESGDPEELKKAVEILERGRTFVWATLRGYRPELDMLKRSKEEDRSSLAKHFENLSKNMEHFAILATLPSSDSSVVGTVSYPQSSSVAKERWVREGNKMRKDWENAVAAIRSIPAYENFLRPRPFALLHRAASRGPVILFNLCDYGTDALIVLPAAVGRPAVVNVRLEEPAVIRTLIRDHVEQGRRYFLSTPPEPPRRLDFHIGVNAGKPLTLSGILQRCFDYVMKPVIDEIIRLKIQERRIWLCPTGALAVLPIHGTLTSYSETPPTFIPSYIPSLAALLDVRKAHPIRQRINPNLLFVAVSELPDIANMPKLQSVEMERTLVRQIINKGRDLVGPCATREAVQQHLSDHPWIHFACHGLHNDRFPFESAFMLYDENFTLRDILRTSINGPQFAFLSACETAAPSDRLPDEALHLAAAFQFCGYTSVIATLWPIYDAISARLAGDFYKKLLDTGQGPVLTSSAEALYDTVKKLRNDGTPLELWLPFIHIGI